jgi:hypothetical protein
VITHELIHLIHPHDGNAFYELVETLMPDWCSRKQRLQRLLARTGLSAPVQAQQGQWGHRVENYNR